MQPSERYDSLFQFYAEWDRDKTVRTRLAFVKRPAPLDWMFLKRQAVAESGLDPDAISPVGAVGLTQFMTATWLDWMKQEYGPEGLPPNRHVSAFDPEEAINAQADVMAWLLKVQGGNARKALASYNWGIGHVTQAVQRLGEQWETALPDETRGYLTRILG